jgi:hypothetical protein
MCVRALVKMPRPRPVKSAKTFEINSLSTFLARHNNPVVTTTTTTTTTKRHKDNAKPNEWDEIQRQFIGEFTKVQARGELGRKFELLFSFLCDHTKDITPLMDALQARFADETSQAGYVFHMEKTLKTNYLVVYIKRA